MPVTVTEDCKCTSISSPRFLQAKELDDKDTFPLSIFLLSTYAAMIIDWLKNSFISGSTWACINMFLVQTTVPREKILCWSWYTQTYTGTIIAQVGSTYRYIISSGYRLDLDDSTSGAWTNWYHNYIISCPNYYVGYLKQFTTLVHNMSEVRLNMLLACYQFQNKTQLWLGRLK